MRRPDVGVEHDTRGRAAAGRDEGRLGLHERDLSTGPRQVRHADARARHGGAVRAARLRHRGGDARRAGLPQRSPAAGERVGGGGGVGGQRAGWGGIAGGTVALFARRAYDVDAAACGPFSTDGGSR